MIRTHRPGEFTGELDQFNNRRILVSARALDEGRVVRVKRADFRRLVTGEPDIGEIIIQGSVIGNIRAKRGVEIHAPGRVRGDITTPSLQIDKGVVFEGRSYMEGVTDGTIRPRAMSGGGPPPPPPPKSLP